MAIVMSRTSVAFSEHCRSYLRARFRLILYADFN
jgi:hypothetical protein